MTEYHAYAAPKPGAPLQPFSFRPRELGPEEVEIKVTHCGICHSDVSMLDDEWGMSRFPFVPGHEAVGTVVALGKEAKGLRIGQRVGVGWSAQSCLSCDQCLSGDHHLCATVQGTIVGRYGGFANYLRVQWTWARPVPDALDMAKTGPLLCGGITVFSPFLIHQVPATARVGVIGIGGLGHLALQFANKWGCEVHAFTTSDSKEAEARRLGAHHVHNTKTDGALKPLASSLDLLISTVNVPHRHTRSARHIEAERAAPRGRSDSPTHECTGLRPHHAPEAIAGSPTGSPTAIDRMLEFCARHSVAPVTESFPMSKVNAALEYLRAGKARYRIVLTNDIGS